MAFAVGLLMCLLYGFFAEPKILKIRRVTIVSENWRGSEIVIISLRSPP